MSHARYAAALLSGFLGLAAFHQPQAPAVHEIRMTSARFIPATITARAGDTLRFTNELGGPHSVQFFSDSIPEASRALLERAMPGEKIGPLSSPLLVDENDTYEIAVPALPPGRYPFVCLPHFATGMTGTLVVVP